MRRKRSKSEVLAEAVIVRVIELSALLCALFLVLKLMDVGLVADWSWWAVTSPFWGTGTAGFAVFVFALVLDVYVWLRAKLRSRKSAVRRTR